MADEESSLRQVRFVVQASLDIDTTGVCELLWSNSHAWVSSKVLSYQLQLAPKVNTQMRKFRAAVISAAEGSADGGVVERGHEGRQALGEVVDGDGERGHHAHVGEAHVAGLLGRGRVAVAGPGRRGGAPSLLRKRLSPPPRYQVMTMSCAAFHRSSCCSLGRHC